MPYSSNQSCNLLVLWLWFNPEYGGNMFLQNVVEFQCNITDYCPLQYNPLFQLILSCVWLTIDGVWVGNWIYWTLTDISYYSAIANSHTLQFITARTKSSQSAVFISHCTVTVYNSGHSHYSGFPNYPHAKCQQLPASNSNSSQGLNCSSPLTHSPNHQPTRFTPLHCVQ
jgi:hypothetical protein